MNAIPDYIVESFEAGAAEIIFASKRQVFIAPDSAPRILEEEKMKVAFWHD